MINIPKIKIGIVAVSRDCFPEPLSVNRRKALVEAYKAKYDETDIYECPVCIVESEIHMVQALEDAGCTVTELDEDTYNEFKDACMKLYEDYEADGTWSEGLYDKIQEIIAG